MSEQTIPTNTETEATETPTRRSLWIGIFLLLLLILLAVIAFWLLRPATRPLQSVQATIGATFSGKPLIVTFEELNDNADEYQNQRIRVTGDYFPIEPPDCKNPTGPRIRWGLVNESLQLNALGFEEIVLPIVEPNTTMTLEGIWRWYGGPTGCPDAPKRGLWYLEVEQILQPNPLLASTATPVTVMPVTPLPFPGTTSVPPLPGATTTPAPGTGTSIPALTATTTGTVTDSETTATATATPDLTASPTATSTGNGATTTPPLGGTTTTTATPTPTIGPGTPGTPGTPGATAPPGPTQPPINTATPGPTSSGYPPPSTPGTPSYP